MTKTLCLPRKQTLLLLAIFAVHGIFAQTIRYVNASVSGGSNNGTNWVNAYKDLQPALAAAQTGDQIWVAKGAYYPTASTTDRTASFVMKNNVGIYGGFAGTETAVNQRDWTNNVTTLSGDIDHATDPLVITGSFYYLKITGNVGNSFHVVNNSGLNNTAFLDGFTISGGNANNYITANQGAGMLNTSSSPILANLVFSGNSTLTVTGGGGGMFNNASSPILTNCTFMNNKALTGGGMFNSSSSSPILTTCTFFQNTASDNNILNGGPGGGMYNSSSSPILVNCLFSQNSSLYVGGGGMANSSSSPSLTNCIFFGNGVTWSSGGPGGGMYNSSSSSNLVNCVFYANASEVGGGMYNSASTTNLTNCTFFGNFTGNPTPSGGGVDNDAQSSTTIKNNIIWGNTPNGITNSGTIIVSYSDVQGTGIYTGTGNINQDPLFVNTANPSIYNSFSVTASGLALQSASPCINKGSNAALPTGDTTDITGAARIQQGIVDMGAYENIGCFTATRLYVNAAATSTGDGSSWGTAYQYLTDAIHAANVCSNVQEIWVAKGTYYPTSNSADRSASFFFKNNLAVYGGFAGTETTLSQRDWKNNATILSGDIDHTTDPLVVAGSGNTLNITGNAGNSFHVVFGNNLDKTSILDGFTITGGNASGTGGTYTGPITTGSVSSPQLYVVGGGLFNNNSSPTFGNLIFSANYGFYGGGLVNINNSSPSLANVVFSKNKTFNYGGGLYNYNHSTPSLVNVLFSGNNCSAGTGGGGIYNDNSSPTLTNASFSGNYALVGADIYNDATAAPAITNSIIWGNPIGIFNSNTSSITITNSNIQGGYTGTGNINQDPLFVNAANPAGADGIFGTADDGLALQPTSPSINKGSNAALPIGITADITGLPRIMGGTVDMGAYEFNYVAPTAFTGCPNVDLAIARPGTNTYNGEPVSMYYMDTATGAATLIAGGPLKDSLTGKNIDINGAGLNALDGYVYAIKSIVDTAPFTSTAKLYRIGSNYANTLLGTLPSPPLTGNDNDAEVNPIAGAFDDNGNYYYLAATGTVITASTYADFTLNNFYIGKISGLSALNGTSPLQTSWMKVNLANAACGPTLPGSGRLGGAQDLAYSNLYRSIYVYFDFSSSGTNYRQLITVDPSTGNAKCYGSVAIPYVSNDEISGISTTASGNLRILMTSGDVYKPIMNANGDFTSTLTKIGASGIASPNVAGNIRGDLASCSIGPTTLPTLRPSSITVSLPNGIVAYPNPVQGSTNISVGTHLTNATIRLLGLAGNVMVERNGVSGTTFQIDLTGKPNGMYIVEVVQGGSTQKVKIIKE